MCHRPRHPRHRIVIHARPAAVRGRVSRAPQPDIVGAAAADGAWTGKALRTLQRAVKYLSVLAVVSAFIEEAESLAVYRAGGELDSFYSTRPSELGVGKGERLGLLGIRGTHRATKCFANSATITNLRYFECTYPQPSPASPRTSRGMPDLDSGDWRMSRGGRSR